MTRHTDFEKRIAVYRSLGARERIAVDRHMSACASCAAVYARYAEMDDKLVALPRLTAPASLRVHTETMLYGAAGSGHNEAATVNWWQVVSASFAPVALIGLVLVGLWLAVSLMSGPDRGGLLPPTRTPTATFVATGTVTAGKTLAATVSWAPGGAARLAGGVEAERNALIPRAAPLPTPVAP